jgi:hypothetical protein
MMNLEKNIKESDIGEKRYYEQLKKELREFLDTLRSKPNWENFETFFQILRLFGYELEKVDEYKGYVLFKDPITQIYFVKYPEIRVPIEAYFIPIGANFREWVDDIQR